MYSYELWGLFPLLNLNPHANINSVEDLEKVLKIGTGLSRYFDILPS